MRAIEKGTKSEAHGIQVPSPVINGRDKRLESVSLHSESTNSGRKTTEINYNNSDRLRHQRTHLDIMQP